MRASGRRFAQFVKMGLLDYNGPCSAEEEGGVYRWASSLLDRPRRRTCVTAIFARGLPTVRGRKPNPTHLKILANNPGKRPLNMNEPVPAPGGMERPPIWLNKRAKAEWRELLRAAPPGLLTRLDRKAVALYCQTVAQIIALQEIVDEVGLTFLSEKGFVCQRPEIGMLNKEKAILIRLCAELGLTPSSRSRVKLIHDQKPKSKLAKFIA